MAETRAAAGRGKGKGGTALALPHTQTQTPPLPVPTTTRQVELGPVPAATLYDLEVSRRRRELRRSRRGPLRTGCREVDEEALLGGGFERGSVVGVSAEEGDFGVLVSEC